MADTERDPTCIDWEGGGRLLDGASDGTLSLKSERDAFMAHLFKCTACRARWRLRQDAEELRDHQKSEEPDGSA